ncbi:hypothetical protein EIKCOROL_01324 [Eikenella corrodens ATCC 23834]|uniref:Uncharacterized protein n=1 Tax=Eikenella corrodens ATCC 23834 TaxID=546274 RepID=C0DVD5_EIKCO|nr:hypothetical protein EIKCOROL_01324 [Eikenella corrodens ATCC 23834]
MFGFGGWLENALGRLGFVVSGKRSFPTCPPFAENSSWLLAFRQHRQ